MRYMCAGVQSECKNWLTRAKDAYVWLIHLDINTNQLLILVHWKIIKENALIYINDAVLFSESKLQEPRIILERS